MACAVNRLPVAFPQECFDQRARPQRGPRIAFEGLPAKSSFSTLEYTFAFGQGLGKKGARLDERRHRGGSDDVVQAAGPSPLTS